MENLDFCLSQEKINFDPISVDGIYYVFADSQYNIKHFPILNSFVLVATLNGKGVVQINNKKISLQPGDVLLFDAGEKFNYWCDDVLWNFWWFEFRCNMKDFIEIPLGQKFNFPLDSNLLYLCTEALDNMKLKDVKTASYLIAVLLCLLRKKGSKGLASHKRYSLFREADQYIRKNLDSATVESTAYNLGISERTLRNLFQSMLGTRPVEYIQSLRMDMARHLLLISDIPIKDIATNLGYADQFVFSKSFRKQLGISPTKYRQNNRASADTKK